MKSYVMGTRFQRLASDIAGPLPTTDQGNRYILVIQDYFTKFTEVYPLCDINAETVANVFLKGWIKRYGCPVEIHSDQGTQYESQLFQGICKLLHISKTRTTAMHPRSDGMVERGNRTIKEMLSKYIDRNQSDWDKYIDYMVMAYNSTPHDSTGITPYRMMFGDEMKMPLDLIAGSPSDDDEETHFKNEHSFVAKIREELEKAHEIAREKLKRTAIRQKDYYDRNVKEINYANGDLVRRWQPHVVKGGKKKLYRNWTGPWVIIEKLTDVLFKIKHSKNSPNVVVHADNLKKYTGVKSVSWFKPEKTILHAQPPLINYFDSEHELRGNGALENTHDTEPTLIQSDEYQTDETLEPPENCVYKTLEPSDSYPNITLEPPNGSLNKTLEPPEPLIHPEPPVPPEPRTVPGTVQNQ
ncbi:Hypothetical predicted protein [Mytilus galloprovincialis]|uniref:Integrase catalytic domain-containing protein n=1 Tax=Mytilus galloprovincialis TaxID=29158 RepID=A0A8B6FPL4_MYTGA|nr:Hypothetical predicted protein [Mytilus galloprovincialis]